MSQSQEIPDFHALLRSHAEARPDAVAVADGAREVSYAQFVADIEKVSRRLNTYGLAPGSRAILFFKSHYLHWLAIMALWRLGVVSVSLYNLAQPGLLQLLRAGVLITERGNLKTEGGDVIAIDEDWLTGSVDALPPLAERPFDAKQPVRILLSSGTTGLPKKILYDNAIIGARIRYSIEDYGFAQRHRFMSGVGLDTAGAFVFGVVTLAAGGAIAFYESNKPFGPQIEQTRANLVFLSPVQAAHAIDSLAPDFRHPGLTLIVGGGRMPEIVAQRARKRLASEVWVVYGSTEAGSVAKTFEPNFAKPEAVGFRVPSAQIEVVDESGQVLKPGSVGEVRMRGVCCVDSYLEDPEATGAHFRDDWFYPGDLGTLSESDELSIVGRVGEVMNLGGVKITPGVIEDALMTCPGVKDLAVFSVPDELGVESLWLAVCTTAEFAEEELQRRYTERFPSNRAPNVAIVESIPRNAMSKAQRNVLRDMVKKRLLRQSAPAPTIEFGMRAASSEAGAATDKENKVAMVKINDKEYDFDKLSDDVKSQLVALQYVDTELHRLGLQKAALQTARAAYVKAIGEAIGSA